jgi:hypothetical protein
MANTRIYKNLQNVLTYLSSAAPKKKAAAAAFHASCFMQQAVRN